MVTAQAKNTPVAAEFSKFLVTTANMKYFCEKTTVLPVRQDLVDAPLNFAARPELMKVFQKQATTMPANLVKVSTSAAFPGMNQALVDNMDQYLSDPNSSTDALIASLTAAIQKAQKSA